MKDNTILSLSKYAGEEFDFDLGIRTVYAGKRRATDHREDKNILLFGLSKVYNYLLIDGMCNFLYNNEFKNKSRYHVRNENDEDYDNNGIITRYIFNQAQLSFRPIIYEVSPNNNYSIISQVSTILETIKNITSLCIVISTKSYEDQELPETIQTLLQLFSTRSINVNISLLILLNTGSSYFNTSTLPSSFDKLQLHNKQKYYFNVEAIFSKFIKDLNNKPESSEKMWNFTMTNMAGFFHYISTLKNNSNNKNGDNNDVKEVKLTSILSSSTGALNEIGSNNSCSSKVESLNNNNKDIATSCVNNKDGSKNENVSDHQLKYICKKKDSISSKISTSTTISSVRSETTTLPKDDIIKEVIIEDIKECFGEISLSPVDRMIPSLGKTTYINGNNTTPLEMNNIPTSVSKYPSFNSLASQSNSIHTNQTQSTVKNFHQPSINSGIQMPPKKPSLSGSLSKEGSLIVGINEDPQARQPKRQYTPRFESKPHHYPIHEEDEDEKHHLTSNNLSHSISLLSETASIKHIRSFKNRNNSVCGDCGSCVFYLLAPLFIIMVFLIVILTIIFLT
uniref:VWFA domain-containing protein n=1 Tax=Strongyloides venezuelensis TaxID=75913 RepID=A0A0K0F3B7_STRVS